MTGLHFPEDRIAEFCRRHHIRRLALFGSVLRDDFTSESDVDVLVEFAPGQTPGLAFVTIQDELSEIFGHRVDLHTFGGIERSRNGLLREEILKTAEIRYQQPLTAEEAQLLEEGVRIARSSGDHCGDLV